MQKHKQSTEHPESFSMGDCYYSAAEGNLKSFMTASGLGFPILVSYTSAKFWQRLGLYHCQLRSRRSQHFRESALL